MKKRGQSYVCEEGKQIASMELCWDENHRMFCVEKYLQEINKNDLKI